MKLRALIVLSSVTLMFAGCVTSNVPKSAIGSGAFIHGTNRETTRKDFDCFYLEAIDGASVPTPPFRTSFEKTVPVGPGERLIVVHYEGMDGSLMKRPRVAQATVKAKIETGVTYVVDGRDEGNSVHFWIGRSDTGERITEEVLASKTDLKPPPPVFVPIPIVK